MTLGAGGSVRRALPSAPTGAPSVPAATKHCAQRHISRLRGYCVPVGKNETLRLERAWPAGRAALHARRALPSPDHKLRPEKPRRIFLVPLD